MANPYFPSKNPVAVGFCMAAQLFLAGLLVFDIGGIAKLIGAADQPLLPLLMLSSSLGGLVGAASVGTAPGLSWERRRGHLLPALARVRVR